MWKRYNPNPIENNRVGDCVIRAVSKALGQEWEETYMGIAVVGFELGDMPSANNVWNAYLRRHGFRRDIIPDYLPDNYSVRDFCRDNPYGTYILALSGHVVAVIDGDYFDTWDSGGEVPIYYWHKK